MTIDRMRRWRAVLPDSVEQQDLSWFRAVASWNAPPLDRTLPRLSRAANRSRLWFVISLILALSGNRQARRAALRGVMALGLTSAVTNIPAKLAFRRERPDHSLIPLQRVLRRMPISTSFPSGHSASAAAFATGAALEMPVLGAPLGALAAGVAFSRIYTGAHYPSDVVAGLAIGAGVAIGTTKLWPRSEDEPATARPATRDRGIDASPEGAGFGIVVNPSAGSALSASPTERLRDALPQARLVEMNQGEDLADALDGAAHEARAIGIAGGDGSVNAAAATAHRLGMPLLVVPGGTLNHFARDLGIDSVEHAVEAAREGVVVEVDLALIDGKPFLNTASFGLYPELVDERERREARLGKWPALVVALLKVLRRGKAIEVEINGSARRVWAAFIGNCRYRPSGFAPNRRERLDDGSFDVRLILAEGRFPVLKLVAATLTGRLGRCSVYEEHVEQELKIRSLNGPLRLSRDGESFEGSESVTITKARERLAVLVRPQAER